MGMSMPNISVTAVFIALLPPNGPWMPTTSTEQRPGQVAATMRRGAPILLSGFVPVLQLLLLLCRDGHELTSDKKPNVAGVSGAAVAGTENGEDGVEAPPSVQRWWAVEADHDALLSNLDVETPMGRAAALMAE
jgi:hypothetical protein